MLKRKADALESKLPVPKSLKSTENIAKVPLKPVAATKSAVAASNAKPTRPVAAAPKAGRPAWDLKGRIQDLESYTSVLVDQMKSAEEGTLSANGKLKSNEHLGT